MAVHVAELRSRLGRVRRRWRLATSVRGMLLVLTEALGLLLLIGLADWIYNLSGDVRLGLLAVGGAALAVLFARHVLYPLLRRITDEQVALLLEERSRLAEGTVISAVEFSRQRGGGLYNYIVGFLVDDAVRRIDGTNLSVISNVRRLRKHVLGAGLLLAAFAATTLTFPNFLHDRTRRIMAPWVSIEQDRQARQEGEIRQQSRRDLGEPPINLDVTPKGATVRSDKGYEGVKITVTLSRAPMNPPVLKFRPKRETQEEFREKAMKEVSPTSYEERVLDVVEDTDYFVQVSSANKSPVYTITVYESLAFRQIEVTYNYPAYLASKPETRSGGDISAPAGTKVDVRLIGNNPLKSAKLIFDDKTEKPMTPGAKAADGATVSFPIEKDFTYTFEITDVNDQTVKSSQFFYVKAVPDAPPTIELVSPKVDMSIHPLYEVTFRAKVGDDYGVKEAVVKADIYKGKNAEKTSLSFPMTCKDAADSTENVRDGKAEYVWEVEKLTPALKSGDMIFYYLEVADRKGQVARTDVFYIKIWPLEVAASWPEAINPPDLPHETFNDPMDLMLFLAAAWHLEQDRGQIPQAEFNAQSEKIAKRMYGNSGDFSEFWGHGGAPAGGGPDRGEILAVATKHIEDAYNLLNTDHQPGKAADHMRLALAMVETLAGDKRTMRLALNPEPLHTGQPSSGHADDPVMEQILFRVSSVMTDSLTAYQQPDNPPRLLPPDYRRALRLKERQGERSKQIREAGVIYATEEQLIEMAREQLGHIQLREAVDDNTPPDPSAQGAATGGNPAERIDKRPIPYKEMVSAAERRGDVPEAEKITLSKPEVDTIKNTLGGKDKFANNERRGGGNPYVSQTAGGTPAGKQDDEEQEPKQPDDTPRVKKQPMKTSGGGGGSGGDDTPQPDNQQPGQQQPGGKQQPGQQMANQQAGLADKTRNLAREVAKGMEAGENMTAKAVDDMRTAANLMDQAAQKFQRNDIKGGIAQAQQAQKLMRSAGNRLTASQYDSLESAVAAAQGAATALATNQKRISQGTEQLGNKVNDLTGKGEPGKGEPGKGEPGKGEPGKGEPGKGEPGKGEPGKGEPGKGEPASKAPSRADVDAALNRDPRLGSQLKSLAVEQGNLATDLNDFTGYVADVSKWAKESAKDRVGNALGSVNSDLKADGTQQKVVDAAVGLAGKDIRGAREAQKDVEKSLDSAVKSLQEAGEILAGSPTQVLRTAARNAKAIGEKAAELAGGQPGKGEPGKGEPGKGEPGKGEPGKGEPGKGEPGKGEPGKGEPGKGEPGKGEPGKGEPGKGEPGKGEPGKTEPQGNNLAQALANNDSGSESSGAPAAGQPNSSSGGGGSGRNEDINMLYMKTKELTGVLKRENLVDKETIQFIERKAGDVESFRKLFEQARKAEAGKFADVMLGVGKNLEATLQEALSAKRLNSEQQEECPPKYKDYVDAYFRALSKAATAGK